VAELLIDILYLILPLTCILAVAPGQKPGATAERFVYGVALYQGLLLAVGLLLGLTGQLRTPVYVAVMAGAACVLAMRGVRHGAALPLRPTLRWLRTGRGAAALLLFGLALGACALELGFDLRYGTRHGDGLWYHIPRVMFWIQQGHFDAWATPVTASIGLPVGADLVLLH
jgi:hypothetical protein